MSHRSDDMCLITSFRKRVNSTNGRFISGRVFHLPRSISVHCGNVTKSRALIGCYLPAEAIHVGEGLFGWGGFWEDVGARQYVLAVHQQQGPVDDWSHTNIFNARLSFAKGSRGPLKGILVELNWFIFGLLSGLCSTAWPISLAVNLLPLAMF